jgi:hypothetical protein
VLNQKGSPAWFSDTFANIPTFGYAGRMFISIDTYAFYRDTGTGWDLIGGPGIGTLTGSGVTGQVSFFNGTQVLTGNNNLFWDNTNSRLGINTTTPGAPLDIHGTGTNAQFNGTGTSNAYLTFQNAGTSKWRIGNTYNAGANSFDIYNVGTSANALSFGFTTNVATFTKDILINSLTIGNGGGAIATNTAIGSGALAVNTTGFQNIAIGTNSLSLNNTGLSNIAIGHRSLENSIGGGGNVAVGVFSLNNVNTGQSNVSIGINAGLGLTTGSNNIFIGSGSSTGITTGSNNTIIGNYAGTTALANNIVLADGAGNIKYQWDGTNNNFTGNVNFSSTIGNGTYTYTLPSATGTLALTSNLSSYLPLAGGTLTGALIGTSAAFTGEISTSGGQLAFSGSGGSPSTGIGIRYNGTFYLYPGANGLNVRNSANSGNTFVVTDSGIGTFSGNEVNIGSAVAATNVYLYMNGVTNKATRIVFQESGSSKWLVGNGAASENGRFEVFDNTNGTGVQLLRGATAWIPLTSDVRLKKNFETCQGLNEVLQIEPVKYHLLFEDDNSNKKLGFKAQNIQSLIPEMVVTNGRKADDGSDYLTIVPDYLLPVLVKAIQELNEKLVRNNIN